jgi:hypothetical protein
MNNNDPDDLLLQNFLNDELPKLAVALEEFKFFVSDCDRAAYQEAWKDYYKTINDGGVAIVKAYTEDDPWSVVEMKIHKLTSFAKTKSAISCCSGCCAPQKPAPFNRIALLNAVQMCIYRRT